MKNAKRQNPNEVMEKIIDTYKNSINQIRNYYEYAKPHKMTIADGYDERTIQEIEQDKQLQKVKEMIEKTKGKVQDILNDYIKSEKQYFQLDGAEITDDYKLLELSLTETQLQELIDRYKDNITMSSFISAKAKSMNVPMRIKQSADERMEIINTFNKMIYPRFAEHCDVEPCKYDFTEQAEKYNEMYQSRFYEDNP